MELLLGHFGSGKTFHICQEVSTLISKQKSFWIIVPSRQHKDQLYRQILNSTKGITDNPVITLSEFQKLLLEKLFPNPIDCPKTLSNFDKFLIISNIIKKNEYQFKAFKNISNRPKIIQIIYRIIDALRDKNIERLESIPHLQDRIHDLKIILDEFHRILSSNNLSDTKFAVDLIASMSSNLPEDFFPFAIFVDGFVDMTPNQFKIISYVLKEAKKYDKKITVSIPNIHHEICHNTLEQFQTFFPDASIRTLTYPHPSHILVDQFLKNSTEPSTIRIHEIQAFGKHREVEEITNQIKKLCLFEHYTLDDILIITKKQDIYAPLFESILRKSGIPYRMTKDHLLSDNPLILFLKKLLNFSQQDLTHKTLEFLAHSNYVSKDLRNILLQAPKLIPLATIGKQEAWIKTFDRLHDLDIEITKQTNLLKDTILALCDQLYTIDPKKEYPIHFFINYITDLLLFLGTEDTLVLIENKIIQDLLEDALAKDYASIAKLKNVFQNIQQSLQQIDQQALNFSTFLLYFNLIISETRYRTNIPKQKVLRITSPEDARGIFTKAVFIIGMNESEFPAPQRFDLFDNHDRISLNNISKKIFGKSLWLTESDYFSEEKLSFALALSRATEQIFFSRTPANEHGHYIACSHFLENVLSKQKSFNRIPQNKETPLQPTWDNPKIFELDHDPDDYYEETLLPYVQRSSNVEQISQALSYINIIKKTNNAYKNNTLPSTEGRAYFGYLSPNNKFTLDFKNTIISQSPTRLEKLGRCRYQGLWGGLCRLKPYELPSYNATNIDYGNLYHYVLEHYINHTKDSPSHEVFDHQLLIGILDQFIEHSPYRQVFLIDYEYILAILMQYLQTQEILFRKEYTPLLFEAISGEGKLSQKIISINEKYTLEIHAKIDRIDQHSCENGYQIIDYKKRGSSYKKYQKIPFHLFQGFLYASLLDINHKNPVDSISYVLLETNDMFQEYPTKGFNTIHEYSSFKKEEISRLIGLLGEGNFSPFTTESDIGNDLCNLFQTYFSDKKIKTEYDNKCKNCDFERICLRKQKLISSY
ncbi:MAG: PD-(D/E)XK nuclease family protein [Brevinema sp.]